jgi:hypothetical protein
MNLWNKLMDISFWIYTILSFQKVESLHVLKLHHALTKLWKTHFAFLDKKFILIILYQWSRYWLICFPNFHILIFPNIFFLILMLNS